MFFWAAHKIYIESKLYKLYKLYKIYKIYMESFIVYYQAQDDVFSPWLCYIDRILITRGYFFSLFFETTHGVEALQLSSWWVQSLQQLFTYGLSLIEFVLADVVRCYLFLIVSEVFYVLIHRFDLIHQASFCVVLCSEYVDEILLEVLIWPRLSIIELIYWVTTDYSDIYYIRDLDFLGSKLSKVKLF